MNHAIKAVLFDLDGLVIKKREQLFSERLSAAYGIPMESISKFFTTRFKEASFGRADLKELLAPYLAQWQWPGTVEDFLTYWFSTEGETDPQVLGTIAQLRAAGIPCYIATRQEQYRMQYLLDVVGLKDRFDGTFVTHEIGYDKFQPEYFQHVFGVLGLAPDAIMFFDDTLKNVETAKALGIDAHFYDGREVLEREATRILAP